MSERIFSEICVKLCSMASDRVHPQSFCCIFASQQHISPLIFHTCHNTPEMKYHILWMCYKQILQLEQLRISVKSCNRKCQKDLTFLSSELRDFQVVASCLVSSCLLGSGSPARRSITRGLCSWQNWKKGLAGLFGAFGSAFAPFLFGPFFGFSSLALSEAPFPPFSGFGVVWNTLFSSRTPIGASRQRSPCWSSRLIKNL